MMQRLIFGAVLAAIVVWATAVTAQEKPADAKPSPEATRLYQDAANAQNGMAFEIAEEGWRKLLKEYPQDPLAAKAQHYLGVCLVQLKKPEQAAEAFQAVLKNHPKFELLEETLLQLASCHYAQAAGGKAEQYAAAADSFAALIKQFPKSKYVPEALYFQGESYYAQGKKVEAAAVYDQLVKEHPKSPRRSDTLYALGVAQEELSKFAEAGATYDVFLAEFATSPLATEVKMRKAETVLQAGDLAAAAKLFAEAAAVKDFASADHAIYRQAFCVAKQDKFAEAGALYAKIPTSFAQSAYVADATIAAGRCFYKADRFEEAAIWLGKAAERKDVHAAEAAHWLCRILLKNKKPAEAAELANKQLSGGGDSPYRMHLQMDRADALFEIPDKRAESLAAYAKLAAEHPQHEVAPQALYNAAFAALDLKQYDDAVQHTAAFLAAYPQDKLVPDVKYVAAESHLQLKKYPEAEKAYADLVAVAKDHPDGDVWRVRLGLAAYLQKKYAETIAALSPVVGSLKSPDAAAEGHFLIGASHFHTDKFAEAERALGASLAANPQWRQSDEVLLLLGRAQAKLGNRDAAKASLQRVVAEFATSPLLDQAHYRLGEIAYAADDFPGALTEYDVVASKWPQSPLAAYALYGKGWAQLKTKAFAAGVESFTALLTKFQNHPLQADALFGRAMCRRQAGDAKGAIDDLDGYLKSNPDQAHKSDAQYERGLALTALNDHAGAAKTFDDLLKSDPKYAGADKVLYEIGWALKSQEKHAEAAAPFARLVAEHPESPLAVEASFRVGEDRYEKKEYAEAVKFYTAAKAKAPAGALAENAIHKLGWAHYQLKQFDEALKLFSEQLAAYGQQPLAADATYMKAECLFRLEKYDEAWPAFQAATKAKVSTPTMAVLALLHGGQTATQLKKWSDAQQLLSEIPAKHPETPLLAEALFELARAKQNAGQTAAALQDYEAAAAKSRDHVGARARFMMGEVYFQEKKYDDAAREFQRAMFGFGGEQATPETKNWQAKSGYEAGRVAEVQIMAAKDAAARQKLIADAKRFYTFVAEKHASHELAGEAKKRLEALSKL